MTESTGQTYAFSLQGPGVNVELQIEDQERVAQVLAAALGSVRSYYAGRGSASTPEGQDPSESATPFAERTSPPRLSLREILDESQASRIAEKITAIGQYLHDHEKKEDFGLDEIRAGLLNAREQMPKNLPRDLQSVARKGWIGEVPGKRGRFFVTSRGQRTIASKFARRETRN